MENDQFLTTLFNIGFDVSIFFDRDKKKIFFQKDEFQKIHNKVLVRCIDSSKERGSRATTDDEDLNKRTNIHKMRLKLICVLFEYLNNSSGCENVSLDTIKIVNGEGDPVVIKR